MKVDTMRAIDKWVGIPLCLLVSPVCWLVDLLRGNRKQSPDTRRTLFIELSEMGSAIIADPAMRKLHHEGRAELYFAIFAQNYKSLTLLNTIPRANIFCMNARNLFTLIADVFRFMVWCRSKRITTVIDLELFSRFTALLSFFSGARSRVGFVSYHDEGLYRGKCINEGVRYNPHVHVAVNFVSLVNKALGLFDNPYATMPVSSRELKIASAIIPAQAVDSVKEKISLLLHNWHDESIVLLNVNASDMLPQRRWPPEYFAQVARQLLTSWESIVILATGAAAESEYVQQVVDEVDHPRCVNAAGVFAFEELPALYSISCCMLTNDSGPAHFAAVTPLKVFVLFGPETPALYLPLGNAEPFYLGLPCSPCVSAANHRKTGCATRPCITGIWPEWVARRMHVYLKEQLAEEPVVAG